RVLLTLVYYLVLTPIALLYRLTHRDPLRLRRADDTGRSYWIVRDHPFEPRDLERPCELSGTYRPAAFARRAHSSGETGSVFDTVSTLMSVTPTLREIDPVCPEIPLVAP